MTKITLEQKRLETLRKQLYGKSSKPRVETTSEKTTKPVPVVSYSQKVAEQDSASYLKKDLSRIFTLSFIALGFQALLYLALNNGLVTTSFLNLKN